MSKKAELWPQSLPITSLKWAEGFIPFVLPHHALGPLVTQRFTTAIHKTGQGQQVQSRDGVFCVIQAAGLVGFET